VFDLLLARRFGPLFVSQFLAAFGDNLLRAILITLVVFGAGIDTGGLSSGTLVMLASATFVLPFMILSGLGGEIADRFDKAAVARWTKGVEILVVIGAAFAFVWQSIPGLFLALFLSGVVSALFAPVKYGILPDHLTREELSEGNAWIDAGTFVAILLGIVVGNAIAIQAPAIVVAVVLVLCSVGAWAIALLIPPTGSAAPGLRIDPNIARSTAAIFAGIGKDPRLVAGLVIVSWFWLAGAVVLNLLPPLARETLHGDEAVSSLLQSVFVVGIAAGSFVAGALGRPVPNLACVVLGAIGMAAFALLSVAMVAAVAAGGAQSVASIATSVSGLGLLASLFLLSAAGGLFIVPSFAEVQMIAPDESRARVVAAVNVGSAAFVALGTAGLGVLQALGLANLTAFWLIPAVGLLMVPLTIRGFGERVAEDARRLLRRR